MFYNIFILYSHSNAPWPYNSCDFKKYSIFFSILRNLTKSKETFKFAKDKGEIVVNTISVDVRFYLLDITN